MIEPSAQEEIQEIRAEGYADPVFFCRYFLANYFYEDMPWVHRGLLAILTRKTAFLSKYGELDLIHKWFVWKDEEGTEHHVFPWAEDGGLDLDLSKFTLFLLPRGFAKTSIAGVAVPLYEILYEDVPFTVYVSHAAPHAKMQLNNVKRELTDNDRIQEVFGDVRPNLKDDEKWSEEMFETVTGVAMAARGRGGQVRGLLHRGQRPKKIIVDDLEDKDSVNTQLQRDKTREWFYGDLVPALPQLDPDATVVYLGTLLHSDALPETLKIDPMWTVIRLGAKLPDGTMLWKRMMNQEQLDEKKNSMAIAGQIHVFYMEYMNIAVAPEERPFDSNNWIYEPCPEDKVIASAVYIDPATSPRRTADRTAIIGLRRAKGGIIYVSRAIGRRGMSEREKTDEYFKVQRDLNARFCGVESIAYQAALISTFQEAMFRKNQYFEITAITHKTRKTIRIVDTLVGRIASGYIRFERRFPEIEVEAADFRTDTDDQKDDFLDALAACVQLLDPTAAAGAWQDFMKDTMPPLEDEIGFDAVEGWVH